MKQVCFSDFKGDNAPVFIYIVYTLNCCIKISKNVQHVFA